MANRDTVFLIPGGQVTGADIENVLSALKVNKEAAAYALDTVHIDHRTHQQGFMRVFVHPLICMWGKDKENGRFDDRNRATVEFASRCLFDDNADMHFPYI